ncbi:MAG: acyltransferase [Planctomycetaceae bacterium]|nr:acyltransferase [Planctomycetaceae bacterium]
MEKNNTNKGREGFKAIANYISIVLAFPCALLTWIEGRSPKNKTAIFDFFAHLFALAPGIPGMYLRRAYYHLVLDQCDLDCAISFGTIFTKRQVRIEPKVYIGIHALIGSAWLKRGCLIGSRASLLSGPQLHDRYESGEWGPTEHSRIVQIQIGAGAWIGEGAISMVNIDSGAMVAAGAVVSTPVPAHTMVAGNPARFVRKMAVTDPKEQQQTNADDLIQDGVT